MKACWGRKCFMTSSCMVWKLLDKCGLALNAQISRWPHWEWGSGNCCSYEPWLCHLAQSLCQEEHLSQVIMKPLLRDFPQTWGFQLGWEVGSRVEIRAARASGHGHSNSVLTPNCGSLPCSLLSLGRAPVFINWSRLKDEAIVNYCQDSSRRTLSFLFSQLLSKLVKDGSLLSQILPSPGAQESQC